MQSDGTTSLAGKVERALESIALGRLALWVALSAIAWSVFLFPPRFENWNRGYPYSWETFRGAQYLMQSEQPLRRDVEPAMHWRLLPPLVAHGLGFKRERALVIPWAGVVALLAVTFHGLVRHGVMRVHAWLVVLGLSLTGGALTPVHWLGINDAWAWFGLAVVTLGRGRASVLLPALLLPWVDERFLIALPLALLARGSLGEDFGWPSVRRTTLWAALGVVPYLAARLVLSRFVLEDGTGNLARFTWEEARRWLPLAPGAWWMAVRAAWVLALAWLVLSFRRSHGALASLPGLALAATLGVTAIVAHDLTRSTGVMWPALVAGAVLLHRQAFGAARWIVPAVALLNAALPTGHVVYVHTLWMRPLGWWL